MDRASFSVTTWMRPSTSSPNTRSSAGSTPQGALDWQTALSVRYTSLHFSPDLTGDLLYNGIAQDAFKSDTALGWQTDASYKIATTHTVRFGLYFQHDSSTTRHDFECPARRCQRHADEQCPSQHRRQRQAVAGDRERISAG